MNDVEAKALTIRVALEMAKHEGYFTHHEIAHCILENKYFYQGLHLENLRRKTSYRKAQLFRGFATIVTFGLYPLFAKKRPFPDAPLTPENLEIAKIPTVLLPKEVSTHELTTGRVAKILDTLVAEGFLTTTGIYPGTVYYITKTLKEVSI